MSRGVWITYDAVDYDNLVDPDDESTAEDRDWIKDQAITFFSDLHDQDGMNEPVLVTDEQWEAILKILRPDR